MTTIYLLTEGEYSDFRVLAAFTNRDEADRCAERGSYDVQEIRLYDVMPDRLMTHSIGSFAYDEPNTVLERAHVVEDWDIDEDSPLREGKAIRFNTGPNGRPWFEALDRETAIGAWNDWAKEQS